MFRVWARPLSKAEAREQFAFTADLRQRVQKRKAESMDVVAKNSMLAEVACKKGHGIHEERRPLVCGIPTAVLHDG